jgi:hypothetical protein
MLHQYVHFQTAVRTHVRATVVITVHAADSLRARKPPPSALVRGLVSSLRPRAPQKGSQRNGHSNKNASSIWLLSKNAMILNPQP